MDYIKYNMTHVTRFKSMNVVAWCVTDSGCLFKMKFTGEVYLHTSEENISICFAECNQPKSLWEKHPESF